MEQPWVVKHRPKTLGEVVGNKKAIERLRDWLEGWLEGSTPEKKAALLYGPPGTGKTVAVEALCRDYGLDLIEVNASDQRDGKTLERLVGGAVTQGTLFGRKRAVLIDELDGINLAEDVGVIYSIADLAKRTLYPIFLVANNPWDPKLYKLREVGELIEFKRLGVRDVLPYLKKLCVKEGVEADEAALRFIVENNQGDMRGVINDLEVSCKGKGSLTYEDVQWVAYRDRQQPIFEALAMVFGSRTCQAARAALQAADVDYEMLFEWIYENAPLQLKDPEDLHRAMEALAKGDLYLARAKRTQSWDILKYFLDMITAGVAMARENARPGWTPMRFPERIRLLARVRSMRQLKERIGSKIAARCHISKARAITDYLPYLRVIFESDGQTAERMAEWLRLEGDEVEFLKGAGMKK